VRIEVTESTPRTTGAVSPARLVETADEAVAAADGSIAPHDPVAIDDAAAARVAGAAGAAPEHRGAQRPHGFLGGRRLGRARMAVAERFRLPASHDPTPQPARMLGVCAWATALGILGIGVALRALVAMLAGQMPHWFEPAITTTGLLGIALTAAAFAAVHRRRLPWALLGAATLMLGATLAVSLTAL
jgi:hypothetical protein